MASDPSIGRYRRWYGRLLRLYPRRFHQRFAEPLTQTFTDLLDERRAADQHIHTVALGAFTETAGHIVRENMTQLMQSRNYLRWVLVTVLVLAVPALAMALNLGIPDPGSGTEGLNWGPMDFAIIGVLVLGSGLLYEYASTLARTVAHRAAIGIAVLVGLGLVWVNLAVGMMDVESGNLMYVLVLFVALVGAAIGRFEARHASNAMFVAAAVHAAVAVVGFVAGLGPTLLADGFFVLAWLASGVLFRRAAVAPATSR